MRAAWVAGAVLAALAMPARATTYNAPELVKLTKKDLRRLERERRADARLCRNLQANPGLLDEVLTKHKADKAALERIADRFNRGEDGCQKDDFLAIALAERLVGVRPLEAQSDHLYSLRYYRAARGMPEDLVRAEEITRIMWLRGFAWAGVSPIWSDAEKRAFIARDDVWTYLNGLWPSSDYPKRNEIWEALIDPLSPRRDIPRAIAQAEQSSDSQTKIRAAKLLLEGQHIDADPARAEALLVAAARYADEARGMLLPILTQRLASKDVSIRDSAFKQLSEWARCDYDCNSKPSMVKARALLAPIVAKKLDSALPADRQEALNTLLNYRRNGSMQAEALLLPWLERELRSRHFDRRVSAWSGLSRLSLAGSGNARQILLGDMARSGGPADGGQLTLDQHNLKNIMSDGNYPASALRQEREGVVEAEAIFAPDGRAVSIVVIKGAALVLNEAVVHAVMRRIRVSFPQFPNRYVRAKLPPIQFHLPECDGLRPNSNPLVSGALVIEGNCPRVTVQSTAILR